MYFDTCTYIHTPLSLVIKPKKYLSSTNKSTSSYLYSILVKNLNYWEVAWENKIIHLTWKMLYRYTTWDGIKSFIFRVTLWGKKPESSTQWVCWQQYLRVAYQAALTRWLRSERPSWRQTDPAQDTSWAKASSKLVESVPFSYLSTGKQHNWNNAKIMTLTISLNSTGKDQKKVEIQMEIVSNIIFQNYILLHWSVLPS